MYFMFNQKNKNSGCQILFPVAMLLEESSKGKCFELSMCFRILSYSLIFHEILVYSYLSFMQFGGWY